jgi:hypothetical protein
MILVIVILLFTISYAQLTHTFTQTASIDVPFGFNGLDIEVGNDGTIFLAAGDSSLWAYSYDGSSFTKTASIEIPYQPHPNAENISRDIEVGNDGTIFLEDNACR